MSNVFEVKKDIYFTGVVDKDLEVFDIIMETEFGTTYNAYIIKDEKNKVEIYYFPTSFVKMKRLFYLIL